MSSFRGGSQEITDILNGLQQIVFDTTCKHTKGPSDKVEVNLFIGHREMCAINEIECGDSSISRDLKSGDLWFRGMKVVQVCQDSCAKAVICVNLKAVEPVVESQS